MSVTITGSEWDAFETKSVVNFRVLHPYPRSAGNYTELVRNYNPAMRTDVVIRAKEIPLKSFSSPETAELALQTVWTELKSKVSGDWGFELDIYTKDETFQTWTLSQRSAQMRQTIYRFGPFGSDVHLPSIFRNQVCKLWSGQQAEYAEGFLMASQIAALPSGILEYYSASWRAKESGATASPVNSDRDLFLYFQNMTEVAAIAGRDEIVAEFSDLAHLICLENGAEERARLLRQKYKHLLDQWEAKDASRHTFVQERSQLVNEGIATWSQFLPAKFYEQGLIKAFCPELAKIFGDSEVHRKEREKIGKMSASNPYRLGLELMEAIEERIGFWFVRAAAQIAESPLRWLSRRLPFSLLNDATTNPAWNPDLRLQKLANLDLPKASDPFARIAALPTIFMQLDGELSGIPSYVWQQMDTNSKKI